MVKPAVHAASERLGKFLTGRGAEVRYVYLPSVNGDKVGLDDFLAAGHTVDDLVKCARADLLKPAGEKTEPKRPPAADVGPQDGAQLLDDVHRWLGSYVAFPDERAHRAVTLWVAHTHLLDSFESSPRAAFLSTEVGCGKPRNIECIELVVPRPMRTERFGLGAVSCHRGIPPDRALRRGGHRVHVEEQGRRRRGTASPAECGAP